MALNGELKDDGTILRLEELRRAIAQGEIGRVAEGKRFNHANVGG